jgi:hypothetical protein
MNPIQNCAARAIQEWPSEAKTLIILTSKEGVSDASKAIGVSLEEGRRVGKTWHVGGREVLLRVFEETPDTPHFKGSARLSVCNAGAPLSPAQAEGMSKWREAVAGV